MAEFFKGDAHLVLYRFFRKSQQLCHFAILQAVFFYQAEDEFALGRQCLDGFVDTPQYFGADQNVVRRAFYSAFNVVQVVERLLVIVLLFELFERPVFGAHKQVYFGVSNISQQISFLPQVEEGIVHNFFRQFFAAHESKHKAKKFMKISGVQAPQSCFIAGSSHALEQVIDISFYDFHSFWLKRQSLNQQRIQRNIFYFMIETNKKKKCKRLNEEIV